MMFSIYKFFVTFIHSLVQNRWVEVTHHNFKVVRASNTYVCNESWFEILRNGSKVTMLNIKPFRKPHMTEVITIMFTKVQIKFARP